MSHTISVIKNKPNEKTFVFEGDFSIQNIETTKDEIQNNLTDASLVVLDINGVSSLDVCFLQLLYSVIHHCEKHTINLQMIATSLSDESKAVLGKSGFEKIICR